jgi:hypothetical protein
VPVTGTGQFFGALYLPPGLEKRRYVVPVEEALRGAVDEVEVRPDLLLARRRVATVLRGVEAGEKVAAGDQASPDLAEDPDGLGPGEVVQREARDDGAEMVVGKGQGPGEVYKHGPRPRRPAAGDLQRLLGEVRGDDPEAPAREEAGVLPGAAAEVEHGCLTVPAQEVQPTFQPGVCAGGGFFA